MYKLSVDELHKSYGAHQVLKGVSLKAKAGDVISIIGSSGSGKSTFCAASTSSNSPVPGASP
jgi:histidine transport system ATP-binding protein